MNEKIRSWQKEASMAINLEKFVQSGEEKNKNQWE